MLTRRIIPCLDIINRRVTKGVRFQNNVDLGDPVAMALRYCEEGCDELVFYDITASAERRPMDFAMVRAVAESIRIPFAVGGGIAGLDDMARALAAGAEKVSVNSLAVANPDIIRAGADAFGSQCIVLGMDPVAAAPSAKLPSGYEITVRGFRERTGRDARDWARQAEDLGAGEIVVNSVDADGTRAGYDLRLTRMIAESVRIPVVASGGAGHAGHIAAAVREGRGDPAIVAGILHSGEQTIGAIKRELAAMGLPVRTVW